MSDTWAVYAVKYAERNNRTRAESFLDDDHPAAPHGMDYFVWVFWYVICIWYIVDMMSMMSLTVFTRCCFG